MNKHFPEFPALDECQSWEYRDHTDRNFEDYCLCTGLDFSLLKGKTILDLGSGSDATFVKEAREQDIAAYGVNPNWGERNHDDSFKSYCVAATAHELPFQDNSFDFVISLGAIPMYLPGDEATYQKTFNELHRVMADDSWALLDPIDRRYGSSEEFTDIVGKAFGDNPRIEVGKYTSKLVLTKNPSQETIDLINANLPNMDEAYFPIW